MDKNKIYLYSPQKSDFSLSNSNNEKINSNSSMKCSFSHSKMRKSNKLIPNFNGKMTLRDEINENESFFEHGYPLFKQRFKTNYDDNRTLFSKATSVSNRLGKNSKSNSQIDLKNIIVNLNNNNTLHSRKRNEEAPIEDINTNSERVKKFKNHQDLSLNSNKTNVSNIFTNKKNDKVMNRENIIIKRNKSQSQKSKIINSNKINYEISNAEYLVVINNVKNIIT